MTAGTGSAGAGPLGAGPGSGGSGGAGRTWRADLALVGAAFFFGTTFLVVQDAVARVEVLPFLGVRFLIGAAVLWPFARRRPAGPGELGHGLLAGGALLVGYVLQTIGLRYTTATASAFISYLLIVLVPLLVFVVHRRVPHPATSAGVALAVVGLLLLTGSDAASFGLGEILTLGCAFGFAAHIVVLGETATRHDPVRFAAVQITVVGIACLVPGIVAGGYAFPWQAWAAAAGTGVFATAIAFLLMVWAQRFVRPTRAALLLLLEPVFAGVLGRISGEQLGARGAAGAAVIIAAVAISEVVPYRAARRSAALGRGGRADPTGGRGEP